MRTRRSQSSSGSVLSPHTTEKKGHAPVLLQESIRALSLAPDDIVVDATLGGAGHARALVDKLNSKGVFIGFDLDADALVRAKQALADARPTVHLVEANFRHLDKELAKLGIGEVTKVLFDLGWSAYQLDSGLRHDGAGSDLAKAGRGFSLHADEPLHMTYAKDAPLTAHTLVNEWSEESLANALYGWGEERYARRIARAIVEARAQKPMETARELAEIVRQAVPPAYRRKKIHPATKTFQALRIAVNDEMGALKEGLDAAWKMLAPGGRIAVITFHSIEDRLVKQTFAAWEKEGLAKRLTKKPIAPSEEEVIENPRARSAKLRTIEKLNIQN